MSEVNENENEVKVKDEMSGVEMSGVEMSGVEMSGVEMSGVGVVPGVVLQAPTEPGNHDDTAAPAAAAVLAQEDDSQPSPIISTTEVKLESAAVAANTGGSVLVPFSDFAEDVDLRLGRANGNVFHRKQGVEGVHDGQIMVRLKKKRFIVIDYGIVPTISDMATAAMNPHITCPPGAGKQKCATSDCPKIGVPVLLHDSDPEQPHSLYMRSGLCFTCQRLLNEKRRTQRKRKSDVVLDASRPSPPMHHQHHHHHHHHTSVLPGDDAHLRAAAGHLGTAPTDIHAFPMDSSVKRFRLNGEILDLAPDAIIINGPLEGTKHQGPAYDFHDIGSDLKRIVQESHQETENLVATVAACTAAPDNKAVPDTTEVYPTTVDSQPTTTHNEASPTTNEESNHSHNHNLHHHHHHHHTDVNDMSMDGEIKKSTQVQILSLYEKAFLSMSKGIFLLSQWKASWDISIASQDNKSKQHQQQQQLLPPTTHTAPDNSNVPPPIASLPDSAILASAAAVAAAQSVAVTSEQSSSNMIPLLLAAQAKDSNKKLDDDHHEDHNDQEGKDDCMNPDKTHPGGENGGTEVFGV